MRSGRGGVVLVYYTARRWVSQKLPADDGAFLVDVFGELQLAHSSAPCEFPRVRRVCVGSPAALAAQSFFLLFFGLRSTESFAAAMAGAAGSSAPSISASGLETLKGRASLPVAWKFCSPGYKTRDDPLEKDTFPPLRFIDLLSDFADGSSDERERERERRMCGAGRLRSKRERERERKRELGSRSRIVPKKRAYESPFRKRDSHRRDVTRFRTRRNSIHE